MRSVFFSSTTVINKFLNVSCINFANVDKGGCKTLTHQKWIILPFIYLTLIVSCLEFFVLSVFYGISCFAEQQGWSNQCRGLIC